MFQRIQLYLHSKRLIQMFLAQHPAGWTEYGLPLSGKQKCFLGNGQGVFRIMGIHNG